MFPIVLRSLPYIGLIKTIMSHNQTESMRVITPKYYSYVLFLILEKIVRYYEEQDLEGFTFLYGVLRRTVILWIEVKY